MTPHPCFRPRRVSVLAGVLLFLLAFAPAVQSQRNVVIPARSSSSLGGPAVAEPAPAPPAPVVPLSTSIHDKSKVGQVPVPSAPPGRATIETLGEPVADAAPNLNVAAVQRVESPRAPLDVATIKRLSELARELRAAESATRARVNLPADDLFVEGAEAEIHRLAEPALATLVEYLERTLKKNVTVRALYVPGVPGAKKQAWSRVLALIEWLEANSSLDPNRLKASLPQPLDKAAPKVNAMNIGETEYVSRIEVHLE